MNYEFTVEYQDKKFIEISKIMKSLDLNVDSLSTQESFILTAQDKEIWVLEDLFKHVLESTGIKVLRIEGRKLDDNF